VKATIGLGVYAGIKHEGIDVGEKTIEKISPNPRCLSLIEAVTIEQVLLGGAGQENIHLFLGDLVANTLFCIAPGGYSLLTLIEEYLAFGENIAMPSGNCRGGNRVIAQAFPKRFHQLDFFRDRHLGKVGVSHQNFLSGRKKWGLTPFLFSYSQLFSYWIVLRFAEANLSAATIKVVVARLFLRA
jgi:hypothetical protein